MDKTSEKVTKDLRRVERGKKLHETHMKRVKEKILEDNQPPTPSTPSSIGDPTPSASSSTGDPIPFTRSHTIRSNDTYVYDVGILVVLAIGVCAFFAYNTSHTSYAVEKYSVNDGLIRTIAAAGIFFELKEANVKPPKASLDAMDILKVTDGICGGVLVKDFAVYRKWINE